MEERRNSFMSKFHTRWILIISAVLIIGNPFLIPAAHGIDVKEGGMAPDFTAMTLDGKKIALSDFRGKTVFVAFWSSWCSRCKEEMDYLKTLGTKYPELVFLAVNSESENRDSEMIERMEQAVRDWEIPFIILIDDGLKIWDTYKVNALPTSVIVGADGNILFAEPNFYWGSAAKIEKVLLGDRLSLL